MWDRPRPGLKPLSPALAGGFLTTAPPGKSLKKNFTSGIPLWVLLYRCHDLLYSLSTSVLLFLFKQTLRTHRGDSNTNLGLQSQESEIKATLLNRVFDPVVFMVILTLTSMHFQISIFRSAGDSVRSGKIVLTIHFKS